MTEPEEKPENSEYDEDRGDAQPTPLNRQKHLDSLVEAEEMIGYEFSDRALLARALTHSSAKNPQHPSYERLEFLGDSILGLTVTDYLFRDFPQFSEGALSRLRSVLVSSKTLAKVVRKLGLDQYLLVSRGLQKSRTPNGLCADIFEAVVAAIYLDSDLKTAQTWVLQHLSTEVSELSSTLEDHNWKSRLQQHTQKHLKAIPNYRLLGTSGPDHRPVFRVEVHIGSRSLGIGEGTNKKTAEQAAAKIACQSLMGKKTGLTKVKTDSE